jgi:ABC-type transport system involved in multi-copper enzyme maturation permease subunit
MLLISPILNRELVAYLRRGQSFWFLWCYLVVLGFMTAAVWADQVSHTMDRAALSRALFLWCSGAQIAMAGLLGVFIGSGQISSERRRGTFDLLLTTPLRSSEILIGKALASVGYLLLLAIAAIPIYSLSFLLGGVNWRELAIVIYLTLLTGVTYSMIGVACSAPSSRKRGQEPGGGLGVALLLNGGLALLVALILVYVLKRPDYAATPIYATIFLVLSPIGVFRVFALPLARSSFSLTGAGLLLAHTIVEAGVFFLFLALGCRWLRKQKVEAIPHAEVKAAPKEVRRSRLALLRLFPIPDWVNPVAAKDILLALPRRKIPRVLLTLAGVLLFGMGVWGILESRSLRLTHEETRYLYNSAAMMVIGITYLLVFLRASKVVALEADAGTLALLTITPLSARRVVWGKLLAVIVTVVGSVAVIGVGFAIVFSLCYPKILLHVLVTIPAALVAMAAGAALYGSFALLMTTGARSARAAGNRAAIIICLALFVVLPLIGCFVSMPIRYLDVMTAMHVAVAVATLFCPAFPVFLPEEALVSQHAVAFFGFLIATILSLAIAWLLLQWSAAVYVRRVAKDQAKQARA